MTQGPVCPRICNGEFACPDLEISFAQVCLVWHLNLLLSCHELIAKEIWSVESSNAVTTCGPEPYSSYFTSWGRTKKTCRWKGESLCWKPNVCCLPRFSYQAVETAVLHILQLMQGKETLFCGNGKSLAVKQWRQLRELLVACGAQSGPTKC